MVTSAAAGKVSDRASGLINTKKRKASVATASDSPESMVIDDDDSPKSAKTRVRNRRRPQESEDYNDDHPKAVHLRKRTDELQAQLKASQGKSTARVEIKKLQDIVGRLEGNFQTATDENNRLRVEGQQANKLDLEHKAEIASLEAAKDKLEAEVNSLSTVIGNYEEEKNSLKTAKDNFKAEIDDLKAQNRQLKGELNGFKEAKHRVAELYRLNSEKDTNHQAQIEALKIEVATAEEEAEKFFDLWNHAKKDAVRPAAELTGVIRRLYDINQVAFKFKLDQLSKIVGCLREISEVEVDGLAVQIKSLHVRCIHIIQSWNSAVLSLQFNINATHQELIPCLEKRGLKPIPGATWGSEAGRVIKWNNSRLTALREHILGDVEAAINDKDLLAMIRAVEQNSSLKGDAKVPDGIRLAADTLARGLEPVRPHVLKLEAMLKEVRENSQYCSCHHGAPS